jgi:hypothetical protein
MFHDAVLTAANSVVDFDRASLLMDRGLLAKTLRAMTLERNTNPRWDAVYDAQWAWDHYCELHLETYGEYFAPDVLPDWGRENDLSTTPSEPVDLGPNPEQYLLINQQKPDRSAP